MVPSCKEVLCLDCSTPLLDLGDELACPRCGIVHEKEVFEVPMERPSSHPEHLGSFLGSLEETNRDWRYSGLTPANYRYLKMISDYGPGETGPEYACDKMVERIVDRFALPNAVRSEASAILRKVLPMARGEKGITLATVAAYSLITACRVVGVASVSLGEVVKAFGDIGRKVRLSSLIWLTMESPVKASARRPEDYLSMIMARISGLPGLQTLLAEEGCQIDAYVKGLREEAEKILREASQDLKEGHRPSALAASAVYAAELFLSRKESRQRRLTQRALAACGDTAEYTLREQYKEIFMPLIEKVPELSPAPSSKPQS
jgi:transcription initiation factor TFIIIB Brf1 subunit/transcription initiation factor TFIIB